MPPFIEQHRREVAEICRRHHVKRLELFGSGAHGALRPDSDLDFIVEFEPLPLKGFADNSLGLLDALSTTFGRSVDLLVNSAIKNPCFLEAIAPTRTALYAA